MPISIPSIHEKKNVSATRVQLKIKSLDGFVGIIENVKHAWRMKIACAILTRALLEAIFSFLF